MILVVEDDRDTRETIGIFFNTIEAKYEAADSVEEALAKLEKFKPETLLIDKRFSDGDAGPVIKMCQEKYPKTKIILMSGSTKADIMPLMTQFSLTHLLHKPFNLDTLEALVSNHV